MDADPAEAVLFDLLRRMGLVGHVGVEPAEAALFDLLREARATLDLRDNQHGNAKEAAYWRGVVAGLERAITAIREHRGNGGAS